MERKKLHELVEEVCHLRDYFKSKAFELTGEVMKLDPQLQVSGDFIGVLKPETSKVGYQNVVIIPAGIRKQLKLKRGDTVEWIFIEGAAIARKGEKVMEELKE